MGMSEDIERATATGAVIERAVQRPGSPISQRAEDGMRFPESWGEPPSYKRGDLEIWIESKIAEGREDSARGLHPSWLARPGVERR